MWPGPSSEKFGSAAFEQLKDKQRNQMAQFPDDVSGAAAQFDLLRRAYVGMPALDALTKWGGGNSAEAYMAVIQKDTGLQPTDRLTLAYLRAPSTGIAFAKAMARHEAGRVYPMSNADWKQAHKLAFEGVPKKPGKADATLCGRILERAQQYIGEKEIPGKGANQHILEWFEALGRSDVRDDETPWCAAFAGAMCVLEGAQVPPPDDALLARSYLKLGIKVDPDEVVPGDLAIWPRGSNPSAGHINIVESVDHENGTVVCIGGNASNMVKRERARDIDGALGFRCPVPSKFRPDGTKSINDTVHDSPSLSMLVNSMLAAGAAAVTYVWESIQGGISSVVSMLPIASDSISRVVGSSRNAAEAVGVGLSTKVLAGIAAACVVTVIWRQVGQKRVQP